MACSRLYRISVVRYKSRVVPHDSPLAHRFVYHWSEPHRKGGMHFEGAHSTPRPSDVTLARCPVLTGVTLTRRKARPR